MFVALSINELCLSSSMTPAYGPRHAPGYTSAEDTQLLRTVLQDSINLLEQVGCTSSMFEMCEVENDFARFPFCITINPRWRPQS